MLTKTIPLPMPPLYLPSALLNTSSLSNGAIVTWIRLRLLVGDVNQALIITITQACQVCGVSRASLSVHLGLLSSIGVLAWKPGSPKNLHITFPQDPSGESSETPLQNPPLSRNLEFKKSIFLKVPALNLSLESNKK
jgi:hypothetical protein